MFLLFTKLKTQQGFEPVCSFTSRQDKFVCCRVCVVRCLAVKIGRYNYHDNIVYNILL
jgi:hypothetical protein